MPHWCPPTTESTTADHCAFHAGFDSSGVCERMITTAVAEGDDTPAVFVLDMAGRPWETSDHVELIAEWDGMGMRATQSHALRLEGTPAVRLATDRPMDQVTSPAMPTIEAYFVAVVLGVLDEACLLYTSDAADEL